MKYHILFNSLSKSGAGLENAEKLTKIITDKKDAKAEFVLYDVIGIEDYDDFVSKIPEDESIILCGGDGTLNYCINHTTEETRSRKIGYYAAGTGNDFYHDLGGEDDDWIENISKYLVDLPVVYVNGKKYYFINGVGYGIDGYCCEKGDELRKKSNKPVNYAGIAIKGILFHFRPRTAKVTIDGVSKTYKNTWLVPTMKGRLYGGGMIPTPDQCRKDGYVSTMIYRCKSPLKALMVFPAIFKGEHILKTKVVSVQKGKEVTVSFDRPCALQIDGETIVNVSEYTVKASE